MATGYESTTILGHVKADAELKYLPSGSPVLNFSVAVNKSYTDKKTGEKRESVTWYNCSSYGQSAESLAPYIKKGTLLFIEGTPTARAYLGADGTPKASLDLFCNLIKLLGSPRETSSDNSDIPFLE